MDTLIDPLVRLCVWEGEGHAAKRLEPAGWSLEPRADLPPIVLTENLPAVLEWLEPAGDDEEVVVYWDELVDWDRPDNGQQSIRLTAAGGRRHTLAKAQAYPWRCGRYGYRVLHRGVTYYGSFEVVSRLLNESQTWGMHETINRHVEGLIVDYLKLRYAGRTEGERDSGLEEHQAWRFLSWYRQQAAPLLQATRAIELSYETELEQTYVVQQSERRQTARSLRWAAGAAGVRYHGQKYLNRRMQLHGDTPPNRLIKHWLAQLLGLVQESSDSLWLLAERLARNCERLRGELEQAQQQLSDVRQTRIVAPAYQEHIGQALYGKRTELQAASRRLSSLQSLQHECEGFRQGLREALHSPFWREVGDRPPNRLHVGRHPAYHRVHEIWKEASDRQKRDRGHRSRQRVPVLKSTALLYEYYALFQTVEALQRLGFRLYRDTLRQQLLQQYEIGGLQEGTSVKLIRGDRLAEITYDCMLPHHDRLALEAGSTFFSHEQKRKPDLRLDLYALGTKERTGTDQHELEVDGVRYLSSAIVEVKYRPLWNLYSSVGYTETMLQMSHYYMIRHVRRTLRGETVYDRSPVRDVICVYPGDARYGPETETGCGVFLQLYPGTADGETVGLEALSGRLANWVDGEQKHNEDRER